MALAVSDANPKHKRLVANEKFTFDRYTATDGFEIFPSALASFVILTCTDGRAMLECADGTREIRRGETVLLPATVDAVTTRPSGSVELLAMSLPVSDRA